MHHEVTWMGYQPISKGKWRDHWNKENGNGESESPDVTNEAPTTEGNKRTNEAQKEPDGKKTKRA
jgi:hypothetical protein